MSYESEQPKQDIPRTGWHVREVYFEEGEPTMHREPPQREPLTEEQIEAISKDIERSDFFDCVVPFARAIEAAHGIGEKQ